MGGGHSGFCLWMLCPEWPLNVGFSSRAVDESPSLVICSGPSSLGSFCGKGDVLFSASNVPPVEGF